MYNVTAVANSTGLVQFMSRVNTELMFGHLGNLFLIAIGGVLFSSFYYSTGDTKNSAIATTVIVFCLALLLRALSLVGDDTLALTFIAAAFAFGIAWFKRG